MENKSDTFQYRCLSAFAIIMLLRVMPAWSDAVAQKENGPMIQIPLKLSDESDSHEQGWKVIQFRSKPPNKVVSDKDGLHIGVECSVNLLACCLNEPVEVNGVLLRGAVTGFPKIQENRRQGDKKADDFAIRIGLVISGTKKLSKIESSLLLNW